MIEEYFQLDQQPFKISTDPHFYFDSERHRKALSYLQYGLQQAEGFVVITGDAGVGKTTLVEQFCLETENAHILTGTITAGHVEPGEIIDYVLSAYRIDAQFSSYPAKHDALEQFLKEQHRSGRHVLLIVDEAQNLSPETLEELRALSGISVDGSPLLQTFLLGQTAFKSMLAREAMEQFRQRVIAACHLPALDAEQTAAYIDYRLAVAGWDDEQSLFTDKAHHAVFDYTGGVPRNINKLCARLLLQVALDQGDCVTAETVTKVIEDLEDETLGFSVRAGNNGAGNNGSGNNRAGSSGAGTAALEQAEKVVQELISSPEGETSPAAAIAPQDTDNVVPLNPVRSPADDTLPEMDEAEVFGIVEEQAVANSDLSYPVEEMPEENALTGSRTETVEDVPVSRPLSGEVSSILDRLRAKTSTAERPLKPSREQPADNLLIPSIEDIAEEDEDAFSVPQAASLEEVADQIAAHVDEALEATTSVPEEADLEDQENTEEEIPVITHIEEGTTPGLRELKTDLAGFISELREGLITVENSMSVVSDRVSEVETQRKERNSFIAERLNEIDGLLKDMRGDR